MKRTFLISAIAVAAALLEVSCQKEQEQKPSKKLECTAQESYTVAATAAKSVSFDIAANTPWTITSSEAWCKVTPSSSKESSLAETIIVKFEDNIGLTSREATLTIEGEGIEKPTLVKFIQGVPGKITITPFTEKFAKEGGKQTFTVLSNKSWAVTASPSDWLTFEPASGEASEQPVTVTATARYTDGKGHTATVTVTSEDASQSFEASIDGVEFELDEIEESERNFEYTGGEKTFHIKTNIDWKASVTNPDEAKVEKIDNENFKVVLPRSKWMSPRKYTVTVEPVTALEGIEAQTIELTLSTLSYIDNGNKDAFSLNEDGSVTITAAESGSFCMNTTKEFTYGNFIWTFSDVNLTAGWFGTEIWEHGLNLRLYYGNEKHVLYSGGAVRNSDGVKTNFGFDNGWNGLWDHEGQFTAGAYPENVSDLKSVRLLIKPVTRGGGQKPAEGLSKKIWINDVLVFDNNANSGDVWKINPEIKGLHYKYGILNAVGSLTIKTFDVDTDWEKYAND